MPADKRPAQQTRHRPRNSLLARRRSRSSASYSGSAPFDLALDIPADGLCKCPSARRVQRIERDSQQILRHFLRLQMLPRLSQSQAAEVRDFLDGSRERPDTSSDNERVARVLSALADDFRPTRPGRFVTRRAQEMDVGSLSRAQFQLSLTRLVATCRASRTRILWLLLLCAELSVRLVLLPDLLAFCRLYTWTAEFFRTTVSAWVVISGGWDSAVSEPSGSLLATVALALSLICIGLALRRLLSKQQQQQL